MAVTNPYSRILDDLEKQKNEQSSILSQQRDARLQQAQNQIDTQRRTLDNEFSTNARSAYTTYMKDLQNMPLLKARMGSGGQTERAKVDMTNSYQNNFGGLLSGRNKGYQDLDNELLNQRNTLTNDYNQNLLSLNSNFDSQRNTALANQAAFDAEQRRLAEQLAMQERAIAAQQALARATAAAAAASASSSGVSLTSTPTTQNDINYLFNNIVRTSGIYQDGSSGGYKLSGNSLSQLKDRLNGTKEYTGTNKLSKDLYYLPNEIKQQIWKMANGG